MGAVWIFLGQIIFQFRFGTLLGPQVHHRSVFGFGRMRDCMNSSSDMNSSSKVNSSNDVNSYDE